MNQKPRSDAFSEKITKEQTEKLINWLARLEYKKVQALIAAPEPDVFEMQVSLPTLSRFYHDHEDAIAFARHESVASQVAEIKRIDGEDIYQRTDFLDSSTYLIQERVVHLLNEPGRSVSDLQKLTGVCKALCELRKLSPTKAQVLIKRSNDLDNYCTTRQLVAKQWGYDPEDLCWPIEYSGPAYTMFHGDDDEEEVEGNARTEAPSSAGPDAPPQQNAA